MLFRSLGTERAADIIDEMDSDDAADLLGDLSEEQRTELLARIEALFRRGTALADNRELRIADLRLDLRTRRAERAGKPIALQPREFRLLEYLVRHKGQVVTRTMLLENVWDYHFDPQTNVIDVHMSRLRSKIDKGYARSLLHTVRGAEIGRAHV